jgi:ABC-2 type transport system permease protein
VSRLFRQELRLVLRSRSAQASLLLLAALAALAVGMGIFEVRRQHASIERQAALQVEDVARVIKQNASAADAGDAAYYTFHATWDPPSPLAFAALGLRDVAPYALRVRALSLQAQLYDSETLNPESALAGRFDFFFVLVYLAPLFVIALFHDIQSGEREAGRLQMLRSLSHRETPLWIRRGIARVVLLLLALAAPFVMGALISGVPIPLLGLAVGAIALYLAFWSAVSLGLASLPGSSAAHAARLLGTWAILTLVVPTLAHVLIQRAIPTQTTVDLALEHREAVHGAWERPREEVMQRFAATHPHWHEHIALAPDFEWKWYFAFHQLADESVAKQAALHRQALLDRQRWTARVGVFVPPVALNVLLHRMAATDLPAQLEYQSRIEGFHDRLREFYYAYLFGKRPFIAADYSKAPLFSPRVPAGTVDVLSLTTLALLASLASVLAWCSVRRAHRPREHQERLFT